MIFLLVSFLAILGAVIAVGLGVGGLVHWLIPEIDLGMAILIGTVMSGFAIHVFVRLVRSFTQFEAALLNAYEEDDDPSEATVLPRQSKRRRRCS